MKSLKNPFEGLSFCWPQRHISGEQYGSKEYIQTLADVDERVRDEVPSSSVIVAVPFKDQVTPHVLPDDITIFQHFPSITVVKPLFEVTHPDQTPPAEAEVLSLYSSITVKEPANDKQQEGPPKSSGKGKIKKELRTAVTPQDETTSAKIEGWSNYNVKALTSIEQITVTDLTQETAQKKPPERHGKGKIQTSAEVKGWVCFTVKEWTPVEQITVTDLTQETAQKKPPERRGTGKRNHPKTQPPSTRKLAWMDVRDLKIKGERIQKKRNTEPPEETEVEEYLDYEVIVEPSERQRQRMAKKVTIIESKPPATIKLAWMETCDMKVIPRDPKKREENVVKMKRKTEPAKATNPLPVMKLTWIEQHKHNQEKMGRTRKNY